MTVGLQGRPFYWLVALLILMVAPPASADMEMGDKTIAFFVPGLDWKLTIPAADWELQQEKRRPNNNGYYYFLTSASGKLNFSVYLDKTDKCTSAVECRDMFWADPGPTYKNPLGLIKKSVNHFSVLQFYLDKPMNMPVIQSNISAHNYRDGFWVDVHMSKVSQEAADFNALLDMLDQVRLK